jgi:flagellar motor switch protein FliG
MAKKEKSDSDELSGPEKAAIFLLTLGEDFTAKVFQRLEEEEIRTVGRQMAKIDHVEQDDIANLLKEFRSDEGGEGLYLSGDDLLEAALKKAMEADKANSILEDIRSDWRLTLFQKARKLDPKILVNFLRNEHPQTIALVLAVLEQSQAAVILGELKEDQRIEVIIRMSELDKVSPEILVEIDRVLQEELLSVEGVEGQRLGGVEVVAEILNNADRALEASILEGVEEQREELADEIRRLMFVFDDLIGVDDRGVMAILKEVSSDDLKLALKTAATELQTKIFKNMSQRAVEMLKEELEMMGPTRLKDVETAQQSILKIAKRLEQEGKVQLSAGGGEDEFV